MGLVYRADSGTCQPEQVSAAAAGGTSAQPTDQPLWLSVRAWPTEFGPPARGWYGWFCRAFAVVRALGGDDRWIVVPGASRERDREVAVGGAALALFTLLALGGALAGLWLVTLLFAALSLWVAVDWTRRAAGYVAGLCLRRAYETEARWRQAGRRGGRP